MATPPTLVAEYEAAWSNATSPKTVSVTVAAGDVLAVFGVTEDVAKTSLATPTGGSLTYTLQQSIVVSGYAAVYLWTASAASSQTFTLSVSGTGIGWWGINCLRFSGSTGFGASSKTNVAIGAPSLGVTTTADNSAIVVVNGDWQALDGASRTARSISSGSFIEQTYYRDINHYGVYGGYYTDSATAGAKTVGWSAPTGQKYAIIAVEVLGSASATTKTGTDSATVAETTALTVTAGGTDTAAVADTSALLATDSAADTVTLTDAATLVAQPPSLDAATISEAAAVSATAAASDSITFGESATVLAILAGSDTVTSAESTAQGLAAVDAITVTDTAAVAAVLAGTDTASVSEVSTLDTGATPKTGVDSATVAESAALLVLAAGADTIGLVEAAVLDQGAVPKAGADTTTVAELVVLAATAPAVDAATESTAATVAAAAAGVDSAALLEVAAVVVLGPSTGPGHMRPAARGGPDVHPAHRAGATLLPARRPGGSMRGGTGDGS